MTPALTGARLAIVSGKGGVGKTTVAASLAVAAARAGKHVLIAEIEDRGSLAPLFGIPELEYEERQIAQDVFGLSVEADQSLVEYLQHFYGIPRLSRALVRSKAVEFATATAPGLRDILLVGKIKEAEQRRRQGRFVYDLIVLDAPPTGRLPRFLDAPRAICELVHGGPIRTQAQGVLDMVVDPRRCQVVLVTQPEEMSVRETQEAIETLTKMRVAIGPVVVNGLWPPIRPLGRDPPATLRSAAADSSIVLTDDAVASLAAVASRHARRVRNQQKALRSLGKDVRTVTLPYLFTEPVARAEIDTLATELERAL